MVNFVVGVYGTVKGDGPPGNVNTVQLKLSGGLVVALSPGGQPVPPPIGVSDLEILFSGTDQTHVQLFVPGNTSNQTLTLTDPPPPAPPVASLIFDFQETP